MYKFGKRSRKALASAHPDLQNLFNEVIKIHDCAVIYGHRNEEQQTEMVDKGYSKLNFPNSKHNSNPSMAVDVAPYFTNCKNKIDWNNREKFVHFAGVVKGVAHQLGIKIRWGGDWDNDNELRDQTWMDLPHYELLEE